MENNPHDPELIIQAIEHYETMLLTYAFSFGVDYNLAQDIVQDTFVRLCRNAPDNVRDFLKPWLFKVCRNRALEILRKEKKMRKLDEQELARTAGSGKTPFEELQNNEQYLLTRELINALREREREIILLKFQHGLSYREIGEIIGISVSNVGFIIHTVLKKLRQQLQQHESVPEFAAAD